MQTLWVFGDSFSAPYNMDDEWGRRYIKWKGYTPKVFGNIMSEELGYDLKNLAKGGCDNDTIFETIYENAPNIKKDDIIIIGWSSIQRFRIPNKYKKSWNSVIPNFNKDEDEDEDDTIIISKQTTNEILVSRTMPIYEIEYFKRRNFLNWLFRECKLIHWTPFRHQIKFILWFEPDGYGIQNETKGEINDGHYSEFGHQELSKLFIDLLNDDILRNKKNTMVKENKII